MDMGVDPAEKRQHAAAIGVTLRAVVSAYLSDRDLKPNSKADIEKHLKTSFADWADRPVASITRDAVLTKFRSRSQHSPSQANQAFVILRALLNYARAAYRAPDGKATLPENPVAVLSEAKLWNKEKARTTRIPIARVGAAWYRLRELLETARTKHERTCIDYVAFLMLTGARGSEAAELTWDRVDLVEDGVSSWHLASLAKASARPRRLVMGYAGYWRLQPQSVVPLAKINALRMPQRSAKQSVKKLGLWGE